MPYIVYQAYKHSAAATPVPTVSGQVQVQFQKAKPEFVNKVIYN